MLFFADNKNCVSGHSEYAETWDGAMKLKDLIDIQKQCEFCRTIWSINYQKMVLKISDTKNPFSLASKKEIPRSTL